MIKPLAIALVGGAAALVAAAPARADLTPAVRQQVFDKVWTLVRDKHWDPTLGGVDWVAVRKKYAPKVAAVKSDSAFYALLQAMIEELKQSHFNVIPPDAYTPADVSKRGGGGETGMTLSLIEGEMVITEVTPDSPADKAGLKTGFAVDTIDGQSLKELLARLKERKERPEVEQVESRIIARHLLSAAPGEEVKIAYRDGDDKAGEVALKCVVPRGTVVTFGNLPPLTTLCETRTLPGGYGYVRFNIFLLQPLLTQIQAALVKYRNAPGIVIDVRGNPGGQGAMAIPIAASLTPPGKPDWALGVMTLRGATQTFRVLGPQRPFYAGPVDILVDEMSLSTSEVFAGGMQEAGRATIVGRTTGGMVLPSVIESLPGGVRFQYAIADFKTPKGVLLEGRGVRPDVPVELTRKTLLASPDPILDAAIAHLQKQAKKS